MKRFRGNGSFSPEYEGEGDRKTPDRLTATETFSGAGAMGEYHG